MSVKLHLYVGKMIPSLKEVKSEVSISPKLTSKPKLVGGIIHYVVWISLSHKMLFFIISKPPVYIMSREK